MRVRRRAGAKTLFSVLLLSLACEGNAPAQGATKSDEDFLPTIKTISKAADQLIGSSADLLAAADRISTKETYSIDRELVGLGAALQMASNSLKMMEPALLKTERVDLFGVQDKDSAAGQAMASNLRRSKAYRSTLDNVGEAGRRLTLLDPIGNAGPSVEVPRLLKESGQSLIDLDEQSGIGVYLNKAGTMLEWFRHAVLRHDKAGCAAAVRLLGQMIGLAGESLAGSSCILWQSAAALELGVSLYSMSSHLPTPDLRELQLAIEHYAASLSRLAESLVKRGEIARSMNAPPELDDVARNFRNVAAVFEQQATVAEAPVRHMNDALRALRGAGQTRTSVENQGVSMQLAGMILKEFGVFTALIETGEALVRVSRHLHDKNSKLAADVLKETGLKVLQQEKPLIQKQ